MENKYLETSIPENQIMPKMFHNAFTILAFAIKYITHRLYSSIIIKCLSEMPLAKYRHTFYKFTYKQL